MPPRDPDELAVRDEIELRAVRGDVAASREADGGELGRLGKIVRSLTADDLARDEPPPAVWQGILARTSSPSSAGAPAGEGPDAGTPAGEGPDAGAPDADAPPAGRAPAGASPPAAPPLRAVEGGRPASGGGARPTARRPPRPWALAAAAAVLALVVLVGGVALASRGDDGDTTVVAAAELEPLPGEPTGAASPTRAELVDESGRLQLDLSTADLPDPDGYYEVWLIDTEVVGMVSLGPARADGVYDVPPGVDPAVFPVVDVSLEPADGVPTHSGVSILRGTLA
jgi:hypothetical protein